MAAQGLQTGEQGQESTETWKVANRSRKENDKHRGRPNLLKSEIEAICKTIKDGSRYALRDELAVLMAYHHGLRASELTGLQWQHIDLKTRQLQVNRKKNGISNVHPITSKREIMLLTRLHKDQGKPRTGFVFNTERKTVLSVNSFQKMFSTYSEKALGVKWNVHALRHSCGTDLVGQGIHLHTIQHFMGHKNLQNTAVYLNNHPERFKAIEWD